MKSGCATALVLNKWDLTSGDEFDLERERRRVARKLRLRPKVLTASAKTGRHVQRLLVEVLSLADRYGHRIPTPELNRFLGEVVAHAAAAAEAGPPAQAALHRPDRRAPAALLDPGQQPRQGHARLRLLRREPAARALRAGGDPGDHRLRRAQAAPPRGVIAPFERKHLAALAALAVARARRAGSSARARRRARRPHRPRRAARARRRARLRAPLDRPRARRPTRGFAASRTRCRRSAACATGSSPPSRRARSTSSATCGPWLGDELAYAAVSPADSVVLAAVADRAARRGARRARRQPVRRRAVPRRARARRRADRDRVRRRLPRGRHRAGGARGDRPRAGRRARARRPTPRYRRAIAGRPPERSLDAYASAAGVRSVLAPRDGLPARSARCSTGPG